MTKRELTQQLKNEFSRFSANRGICKVEISSEDYTLTVFYGTSESSLRPLIIYDAVHGEIKRMGSSDYFSSCPRNVIAAMEAIQRNADAIDDAMHA